MIVINGLNTRNFNKEYLLQKGTKKELITTVDKYKIILTI